MKKFQFTLNKLLDYKDQLLEREKNELAAINAQLALAYDEEKSLQNTLKSATDEFNEKAAAGMSALEMTIFTMYHKSLRTQIEDAQKNIERILEEKERQTEVVTEASKDVKSLEKLEEKQYEEYSFRAAKAEEAFIEEYVVSASARQIMRGASSP